MGEILCRQAAPINSDLGYLISQNSTKLETDYLFAAVLAAMLLGVAIFGAVSLLGELILRLWHAPGEAADASSLNCFVSTADNLSRCRLIRNRLLIVLLLVSVGFGSRTVAGRRRMGGRPRRTAAKSIR